MDICIFPLLAILNNDAVNIYEQVLYGDIFSSLLSKYVGV